MHKEMSGEIPKMSPQVLFRCNYCNQSCFLHDALLIEGIELDESSSGGLFLEKLCPSCRKSLPQCSICLLSLGVPIIEEVLGTSFRNSSRIQAHRIDRFSLPSSMSSRSRETYSLGKDHSIPFDSPSTHSTMDPHIRTLQDDSRAKDVSRLSSVNKTNRGTLLPSSFLSWCQTCRHGGHASHIHLWFASHRMCPVPDCNCCCLEADKLGAIDPHLLEA